MKIFKVTQKKKLIERIEFRVNESEKKFFLSTEEILGIKGSELARHLLNVVKTKYESGELKGIEDLDSISIDIKEPLTYSHRHRRGIPLSSRVALIITKSYTLS